MAKCWGSVCSPDMLPVMGSYCIHPPQDRTQAQTLVPRILLGHCPMANGNQLECFGDWDSDQPLWALYHRAAGWEQTGAGAKSWG